MSMTALQRQQQQGLLAPCRTISSRLLSAGSRPQQCSRPRVQHAACKAQMRPLLLDNYDSYTYNLYQIIAEAYGGG